MKTTTTRSGKEKAFFFLFVLLTCALLHVFPAFADPAGASIVSSSTDYGANKTPASSNISRGTITTVVLNGIQQDNHWKAYVGNVTGVFTLDDASNFTIYSWDITTITGQVYASRFGNLSWSSVACADAGLIANESTFHNMTLSKPDRINATFNWTIHKTFQVGSNTITTNTCNSTVTYQNDTRIVPTIGAPFQEVLVKDTTNNYLIYLTEINDNTQGFNNQSNDFQMIVAESDVKSTPTPYYFYVELR
jgi:hypothetical protein